MIKFETKFDIKKLNENHKDFIKFLKSDECTELLSENNLKELYHVVTKNYRNRTGDFTRLLIECGINIFDFIDEVPKYCFNFSSLEYIDIPEKIKNIDDYAFFENVGLKEITIPGSVERIGKSTFCYCNSLSKVVIKEGVKEIGSLAFYHIGINKCDIWVPDSLVSMGYDVFKGFNTITIHCNHGSLAESYVHDYISSPNFNSKKLKIDYT